MTAFGAGLGCGPLLFSLSLSVPPPHIDQGPAAPHLTHHCPARATCPAVSHSFRGGTPSLLATAASSRRLPSTAWVQLGGGVRRDFLWCCGRWRVVLHCMGGSVLAVEPRGLSPANRQVPAMASARPCARFAVL